MIDTGKFRFGYTVSSSSFNVSRYLENAKNNVNIDTGEVWGSGMLKNMHVYSNGTSVVVEGSISCFLFPNNSRIPKRRDVATAIEQLSDLLHLLMSNTQVVRLDCGYHWNLRQPACRYFPLLCEATYFDRVQITEISLKYSKGGKKETNVLVFNYKVREIQDKINPLADDYGDNVLRYDYKWLGRVARQFCVGQLLVSTLTDENFYYSMVRKWGVFTRLFIRVIELILMCLQWIM